MASQPMPASADALAQIQSSISPHGGFSLSLAVQTRRTVALLLGTLMGGLLVVNSFLVSAFPSLFGGDTQVYADLMAAAGALLLAMPLIRTSIQHLLQGELKMDELAAIAILAALAAQKYQAAGVIAFFMVMANLVETRTALGARMAIEGLIRITPTRARRIRQVDGQAAEEEVDVAQLRPGDVVRIRPGDNIPADGEVLTGESTVNQASITGESLPADKLPGDTVFSGTINLTGLLDVRVTKAGSDTTLGRVQQLILEAEKTRIPLMRLIDRYIAWYTPIVLMIALMVVFFSIGGPDPLGKAITMLVIACPCALVLATPTAMVAALSSAARLGILIKTVGNLEAARKITAIVLDKTGTLTTGQLSVTRMMPIAGTDPGELLRLAASVESASRHPVARAVCAIARRARVTLSPVTDAVEVSGRGVSATVDGQPVAVGRLAFLAQRGVDVSPASDGGPLSEVPQGLSLLYVGVGTRLIGWIGLEDKTRAEARQALDELRQIGVTNLTMVTGDRWPVARKVAAEMGCTQVQAEVLPADKLAIVKELKAAGHHVAVVGDGVNDAPALASGDIGIAMGAAGSDIAISSASVTLMNSDLRRLPFLIQLSRQTTRIIYQNLFFGMLFIVVFMLLAAMGYMDLFGENSGMMLGALLHNIGSIVVILNSARIVRFGEQLHQQAPVEQVPPVYQTALEPV